MPQIRLKSGESIDFAIEDEIAGLGNSEPLLRAELKRLQNGLEKLLASNELMLQIAETLPESEASEMQNYINENDVYIAKKKLLINYIKVKLNAIDNPDENTETFET